MVYYAFDKDSRFVEEYFAKQILLQTDDNERLWWLIGADKLGLKPNYVRGVVELNGRRYAKKNG